MFKFNFSVDEESGDICSSPSFHDPQGKVPTKEATRSAKKHEFPILSDRVAISGEIDIAVGNIHIQKMCFSPVAYAAQTDIDDGGPSEFAKQINETDLAPGEYEGGFKLWECGIDLANYLDEISSQNEFYFGDKNIVELGCGHGIPALYCLHRNANRVAFQDYNYEVLEQLTSPGIEANMKEIKYKNSEERVSEVELFSGDWGLLVDVMPACTFDIILSSDTLYCSANHKKFLKLIRHLLKPKGVAYIASKVYYFGVGGGIEEFRKEIDNNEGLELSVVKSFGDGKSNIRQIIKISSN